MYKKQLLSEIDWEVFKHSNKRRNAMLDQNWSWYLVNSYVSIQLSVLENYALIQFIVLET